MPFPFLLRSAPLAVDTPAGAGGIIQTERGRATARTAVAPKVLRRANWKTESPGRVRYYCLFHQPHVTSAPMWVIVPLGASDLQAYVSMPGPTLSSLNQCTLPSIEA